MAEIPNRAGAEQVLLLLDLLGELGFGDLGLQGFFKPRLR